MEAQLIEKRKGRRKMEIRGDGGRDVTAEVLQARLAHTVEQHLETKQVISKQQQQLNQQQRELEAQSKANTGLAKLGLHLAAAAGKSDHLASVQAETNADLVSANLEQKAKGVIKTVVSTVVGTGVGLLIGNAAAPVAFIPQLDFIPNSPPAEVQGTAKAEVQSTAKKETLPDLQKNVSAVLQDEYPGYNSLAKPYREYIELHVLAQSGAANDVKGYPHSKDSLEDTSLKQGGWGQRVTFPIPSPEAMHKILSLAFGNPENLNETVPPYTMTQDQLTKTLNGN